MANGATLKSADMFQSLFLELRYETSQVQETWVVTHDTPLWEVQGKRCSWLCQRHRPRRQRSAWPSQSDDHELKRKCPTRPSESEDASACARPGRARRAWPPDSHVLETRTGTSARPEPRGSERMVYEDLALKN